MSKGIEEAIAIIYGASKDTEVGNKALPLQILNQYHPEIEEEIPIAYQYLP